MSLHWFSNVTPLVLQCHSIGSLMSLHWFSNVTPLVLQCHSIGSPMSLHWFSNVTLQCHSPNPLCFPCLSRLLKNFLLHSSLLLSSTVPLYNFPAAFLPKLSNNFSLQFSNLIGLPLPYFTIFNQSSFTLDAVLNVFFKKLSPPCPRILSLGRQGATLPASCPTSWCSRK
jgi:hypothetical protein